MIIEVDKTLNRRIDNLIKARNDARCPDFKAIWTQKLSELLRKSQYNITLH